MTPGLERVTWSLAMRWLHDAFVEDVFDRIERSAGLPEPSPAAWSPWVRVLHRVIWPRPVAADPTTAGPLAARVIAAADVARAWELDLRPGMPADPDSWVAAITARRGWVRGWLLPRRARVGITDVDRDHDEIVLGTGTGQVNAVLSVRVTSGAVAMTTVAARRNRRLPLALGTGLHALAVRTMLRHTHRRLALAATPVPTESRWRARASGITPRYP